MTAKQLFESIDNDGSGEIDRTELTQKLQELGVSIAGDEMNVIWPLFSLDAFGKIGMKEWAIFLSGRDFNFEFVQDRFMMHLDKDLPAADQTAAAADDAATATAAAAAATAAAAAAAKSGSPRKRKTILAKSQPTAVSGGRAQGGDLSRPEMHRKKSILATNMEEVLEAMEAANAAKRQRSTHGSGGGSSRAVARAAAKVKERAEAQRRQTDADKEIRNMEMRRKSMERRPSALLGLTLGAAGNAASTNTGERAQVASERRRSIGERRGSNGGGGGRRGSASGSELLPNIHTGELEVVHQPRPPEREKTDRASDGRGLGGRRHVSTAADAECDEVLPSIVSPTNAPSRPPVLLQPHQPQEEEEEGDGNAEPTTLERFQQKQQARRDQDSAATEYPHLFRRQDIGASSDLDSGAVRRGKASKGRRGRPAKQVEHGAQLASVSRADERVVRGQPCIAEEKRARGGALELLRLALLEYVSLHKRNGHPASALEMLRGFKRALASCHFFQLIGRNTVGPLDVDPADKRFGQTAAEFQAVEKALARAAGPVYHSFQRNLVAAKQGLQTELMHQFSGFSGGQGGAMAEQAREIRHSDFFRFQADELLLQYALRVHTRRVQLSRAQLQQTGTSKRRRRRRAKTSLRARRVRREGGDEPFALPAVRALGGDTAAVPKPPPRKPMPVPALAIGGPGPGGTYAL
jgi:hypothetical protein